MSPFYIKVSKYLSSLDHANYIAVYHLTLHFSQFTKLEKKKLTKAKKIQLFLNFYMLTCFCSVMFNINE